MLSTSLVVTNIEDYPSRSHHFILHEILIRAQEIGCPKLLYILGLNGSIQNNYNNCLSLRQETNALRYVLNNS